MANNKDDDDAPTVVLDYTAIKNQLKEENPGDSTLSITNLEFNQESSTSTDKKELKLYLFCLDTEYFDQEKSALNQIKNQTKIKSLAELNKILTKSLEAIVVFYYNDTPKVVNQLSMQLKNKFPNIRTLIIAKNLSDEKAKQHQESKYGAQAYLREPFSMGELQEVINGLQ